MINFPDTPTLNQVFPGPGGIYWKWDGVKWMGDPGGTLMFQAQQVEEQKKLLAAKNDGRKSSRGEKR